MAHVIEHAFRELYPEKEFSFTPKLKYSARFKGYNASIRMHPRTRELTVRLSKQWLTVSNGIRKGLVQELLARLFKDADARRTLHRDLYHHFLKSVGSFVPKTQTNPVLQASFDRVNDQYFGGLMERTNFVLGQGTTKLGHYDFGTDAILISEILLQDERLLDYVMYHEMLHKKHRFSSSKSRTAFHSRAFREDEKKFANAALLEKELGMLAARAKRKRNWFGLF